MKRIKSPTMRDDSASLKVKNRRAFHQKGGFWLSILAILIVLICLQKLHSTWSFKHQGAPPTVVVAVAQNQDVPIYVSALGAVTPTYSVTVKTLINGILLRVLFREGQMVKAGELLAEIDPRPYQAQLVEYEGQLQRDKALADQCAD